LAKARKSTREESIDSGDDEEIEDLYLGLGESGEESFV